MAIAIAFDVYGTLVDPLAMADHLKAMVGDRAHQFAQLWRSKQLEYSFRRALMRVYEPFSVCTREALLHTEQALQLTLSEASRATLIRRYRELPPFPDVARALSSLKSGAHFLAAFSNGETEAIRALLRNVDLLSFFDDVVSVDEVRSFKPDPAVYAHAVKRLGRAVNDTWLVSSNSFDVIGAKAAGLRTAWIKRDANAVLDPWGIEPDLILPNLNYMTQSFAPC